MLRLHARRSPVSYRPRSIKEWFAAHDVDVLNWIDQSCDLNPIENLWRGLNRIIRNMPTCSNLTELAKTITKAWKQLAKDTAFQLPH